jgi:3-oxoacyl-[acyl-carrier-protein] synthase II
VLAIRDSIVPPTINLDEPEDAVGTTDLVPHVAKEKNVDVAISDSFGFGGTNASVVMKKIK